MTEIREIRLDDAVDAPKADVLPKNNPSMPLAILFVASLILSVMNGLGLIYAVSIVDRLSDISTKVARIDDFENRVSRQLAVYNQGIHSQLEQLDSRLITSGLIGDSFQFRTLRNPARLLAPAGPRTGLLSARSAEFRFADQPYASSPLQPASFVPAAEQLTEATANPGFSRSVTPDGKIIYRKMR